MISESYLVKNSILRFIWISSSSFLIFYLALTRGFFSYRNTIVLALGLILLLVLMALPPRIFLFCVLPGIVIPIIPAPLGGFPVSLILGGTLLLRIALEPKKFLDSRYNSLKHNFYLEFSLISLLVVAFIFDKGDGGTVIFLTWVIALLISVAISGTNKKIFNFKDAITAVNIGLLTTLFLSFLTFTLGVKLPGIQSATISMFSQESLQISRFGGILGDYELYAQFSLMSLGLSTALYMEAESAKKRAAHALFALFAFVNVYISGTRFALALAAIFLIFVLGPLIARSLTKVRFWIFSPAFLGVLLVTDSMGTFLNIGSTSVRFQYLFENLERSVLDGRLNIWRKFIELGINEIPWLPITLRFPNEEYGTYPHSLPISLFFTIGVIGTILVLVWLVRQVSRFLSSPNFLERRVGFLAILILIDEMKVEGIRLPAFWITLLLFFSLANLARQETKDANRAH